MKTQTTTNRKQLIQKMKTAFNEKIQTLSPEYQNILLDDLVTALENRLSILQRSQITIQIMPVTTEEVKVETL